MKKGILILSLFCGLRATGQPCNKLDSVFNSINNKDLYVAPVFRGVSLTVRTGSDKKDYPRPMFVVSSLDGDITELANEFSRDSVAAKLYALLGDPQKDMYADALLFQLFEDKKLGKLLFVTRTQWISTGKMQCDIEFWKNYLSAKGIIGWTATPVYY